MLIEGEKYACEACIRGHRVSSCNHSDRELVHVARKGRPVSQCQHCRGQRKARSQHVNCQCGGAKAHDKEHCPHPDGADDGCCCTHTSKCTCAIKKDKNAQIVSEDGNQVLHPKESPKPLAHIKNCHDNKPMVFTGNGHHKPAHKFNDAHNQLGSPYKIPSRSNTIHHHHNIAQRSTDSLPLTKFARPHLESPLHHSITPRQIKSEHNSPQLGPTSMPTSVPSGFRIPDYDPNAYSYSPFTASTPATQGNSREELSLEDQFPDAFPIRFPQAEETQLQQNVDWSSYDFSNFGNTNGTMMMGNVGWTNQALPVASEQFGNLNLGVTPSSGDVTDVDEFGFNRTNQPRSTSGDGSTGVSSPGDGHVDTYRLSVEGTPQSNTFASEDIKSFDIDDFLRQAQEETKRMAYQNQMRQMQRHPATISPEPPQNTFTQSPPMANPGVDSMHPYTIHEAQQRAHSREGTQQPDAKQSIMMPATSLAEDPAWSAAPDMSNPTLTLDDAQEDEDWVR